MSGTAILALTPIFADGGLGPWAPIIFVTIVGINAVLSARRAKRQREEHQVRSRSENEAQRANEVRERLRRLQEERRRLAEGETGLPPVMEPEPPAPALAEEPPPRRGVPPIDPFGGRKPWEELQRQLQERARRVIEERERRVQERRRVAEQRAHPAAEAYDPFRPEVPGRSRGAELREAAEREERVAEERRAQAAAAIAAERAQHEARRHRTSDKRAAAVHPLVQDLRDPEGLRRAFVLREVLGPPVSLRR